MVKRWLSLAVILLIAAAANINAEVYPKIVINELFTSTTCGYCPDAYDGIDVVRTRYNSTEFIAVRYYLGTYSTSFGNQLDNYYNVTGTPTAVFAGNTVVGGGGSTVATGGPYLSTMAKLVNEPSPVYMEIDDINISGEGITGNLTVKVGEDLTGSSYKTAFLIVEKDISSGHTDVVRYGEYSDYTNLTSGQYNIDIDLAVDAGWNTDNLYVAAYIRNMDDSAIIQSTSTESKPEKYFRIVQTGTNFGVAAIAEEVEFEKMLVFNVGSRQDDFTINLNSAEMPENWYPHYCDDGNCYFSEHEFSLDPGQSKWFKPGVAPVDVNSGTIVMDVANSDVSVQKTAEYYVAAEGIDGLIIDDDGGEDFEHYYTDLDPMISHFVLPYDRLVGKLEYSQVATFSLIMWSVGWAFPSLTPDDITLLEEYMDNGGYLFITGQDIGWDLTDSQSDNATQQTRDFYNNYLHADFISDDTNILDIQGVDGDAIGDGLSFSITGGDGANNQQYPSEIAPYGDNAEIIMKYQGTEKGAAVKAETENYKVVYFAFGFEAISTQENRQAVMNKIFDWFDIETSIEDYIPSANVLTNSPNPFNPVTTIEYNITNSTSQLTLKIYDIHGRTVLSEVLSNTSGKYKWNGTDMNSNQVSSGIYFYTITSDNKPLISNKMMLIK